MPRNLPASMSTERYKELEQAVRDFNRTARQIGAKGLHVNARTLSERIYTKKGLDQTLNRLRSFQRPEMQKMKKGITLWERRLAGVATKTTQRNYNKSGLNYRVPKLKDFSNEQQAHQFVSSLLYTSARDYSRFREDVFKANMLTVLEDQWKGRVPEDEYNRFLALIENAPSKKLFNAEVKDYVFTFEFLYDAALGDTTTIEDFQDAFEKWSKELGKPVRGRS